jgi:hypothetical protein
MLARLAISDELVIDVDQFHLAEALISDSQQHIETIFAGVGRNPHAATMAGIQQFIKFQCEKAPHYVTKKKIYANYLQHASQKDIDSLLDQMAAVEQIKLVTAKFANGQQVSVVTSPEFEVKFQKPS